MRLAAAFLLVSFIACRRPVAAPVQTAPGLRLVVHFLDKDATLPLARPAPEGRWEFMNMGAWDPLEIRWKDGSGACAVGRTAPDWLLLRDPEGEVHRLVLHGPGPGELDEDPDERLDPEARDTMILWGLAWIWAFRR